MRLRAMLRSVIIRDTCVQRSLCLLSGVICIRSCKLLGRIPEPLANFIVLERFSCQIVASKVTPQGSVKLGNNNNSNDETLLKPATSLEILKARRPTNYSKSESSVGSYLQLDSSQTRVELKSIGEQI
ncbi:hypothetical protein T265_06832 [Opisthorchis viverrini]|uniref:Uncharacterized protein n=1 Tax=Opisthorchis viverrini TaxID=6198 RepID=A0A074ZJ58_OPIVI|nr:hypothetical protein T265_06832 [Opisthorchis viverrini]KER25802.1 hypothetical protein T265_06832 [Opisthorchis viverrini]